MAAGKPYWDGPKHNLILITMDTTRADHISAYGKHPGLTPRIDKLAAGGTLFLNATSQTNQTNPSHLTIMTGLMGIEHGVLDNEQQFDGKVDMLPMAFKRAGYRTAGFPSSSHVSAWLGWKGFDHIYDVPPDPKTYLCSKTVTDKTIEWLEQNSDQPFFIWVHYWDPHAPYSPPKELIPKFYQGNPKEKGKPMIRDVYPSMKKSGWLVGVTDPEYPMALYRAEVNYCDTHIGRLLDYLDKKNLTNRTGIVLVGDHGENLGEHEMYFNHYFTFESSLLIPYIMRFPDFPANVKVSARVTQLDIAPTIAELYGLDLNNNLRGVSLVKSLKGQPNEALDARRIMVHEHGNNRQIVIRDGEIKIIYTITPFRTHPPLHVDAGEIWVYDLAKDPEEKNNIAREHPQLVDKYKPYVQRWFDLKGTGSAGGDDDAPRRISPEREQALKAMGYMEDEDDDAPPARSKGKSSQNKGKSGGKDSDYDGLGYIEQEKDDAAMSSTSKKP